MDARALVNYQVELLNPVILKCITSRNNPKERPLLSIRCTGAVVHMTHLNADPGHSKMLMLFIETRRKQKTILLFSIYTCFSLTDKRKTRISDIIAGFPLALEDVGKWKKFIQSGKWQGI